MKNPMTFNEILATLPEINDLIGLNILEGKKVVHHIPAVEGKLGSLRLYNALAEKFSNQLDLLSAQQGIEWFAEHVTDAKANVGKHPNIDLLLRVIEENLHYTLQPLR